MSEMLEMPAAISRLLSKNKILIISHKNPDGDTLGAAGALYWGLKSLGKTCAVYCSDPIHERYSFMNLELYHNQFQPQYIVAVDVAGQQLFGEGASKYADQVDLCIDHHGSNSGYAEEMLLDSTAAATCEMMFDLLVDMGVEIDVRIANCLYTGVSTDTGCFQFGNTTARTHRVAARLIDMGAEIDLLNELLFQNKSRQRIAVEQLALASLEYHFDAKCALICITRDQLVEVGADETDLEGVTAMPRSIEGVYVGITMRQQPSGSYKFSVRTKAGLDACKICEGLGGGGHKQAAGCEIVGSLENAKAAILRETELAMRSAGLLEAEG